MIKVLSKASSNKLKTLALAGMMCVTTASAKANYDYNSHEKCRQIRIETLRAQKHLLESDDKITHDEFISYETTAMNFKKTNVFREDNYRKTMELIEPSLCVESQDSAEIVTEIKNSKIGPKARQKKEKKDNNMIGFVISGVIIAIVGAVGSCISES